MQAPLTKFGCGSAGTLKTILFSESKGAVTYPMPVTDEITTFTYEDTKLVSYFMHRKDDGILTLVQLLYSVQRGEMFRVEYTEVVYEESLSDNREPPASPLTSCSCLATTTGTPQLTIALKHH